MVSTSVQYFNKVVARKVETGPLLAFVRLRQLHNKRCQQGSFLRRKEMLEVC